MGLRIPCLAGASQSHPLHLSSIHGSSPTGGAQYFKHVPPATSIEHDVRMFSMLAAQALHARQLPGAIFVVTRTVADSLKILSSVSRAVCLYCTFVFSCRSALSVFLFENVAMVHFL